MEIIVYLCVMRGKAKRVKINGVKVKPKFDPNLLNKAIEKAKPNLSKIKNVDEWINEIKAGVI